MGDLVKNKTFILVFVSVKVTQTFSCSVTQTYPEEMTSVIKSGVAAALVGLVYGGLPAARHARQRYIQLNQAEVYTSRVDAVVSVRRRRLGSRLSFVPDVNPHVVLLAQISAQLTTQPSEGSCATD